MRVGQESNESLRCEVSLSLRCLRVCGSSARCAQMCPVPVAALWLFAPRIVFLQKYATPTRGEHQTTHGGGDLTTDPPKEMQHHPGGGSGVSSDAPPPPWERRPPAHTIQPSPRQTTQRTGRPTAPHCTTRVVRAQLTQLIGALPFRERAIGYRHDHGDASMTPRESRQQKRKSKRATHPKKPEDWDCR